MKDPAVFGDLITPSCYMEHEIKRQSLEKKIEDLERVHKQTGETLALENLKVAKACMNEFLNVEIEK